MFDVLLTVNATSHEFRKQGYDNVFIFLGIGVGLLITNFIQVLATSYKSKKPRLQYMCFTIVCGKVVAQIRHRYVKAILRQNAGWFDRNHSGTLTTKLNE